MEMVNKIEKIITKHSLSFFLFSLLLIKIPPFYIIPFIKSNILTTHTLARLIILILFSLLAFQQIIKKRKSLYTANEKVLLTIFFIYFVFQSLSIASAVEVTSFLQRYKDILFPGLFFFIAITFRKYKKKVIYVLLGASIFNFFYQMLMFWSPGLFQSLADLFIYSGHLELVNINLQRYRMFIETYDEIAIPFIFLFMAEEKRKRRKYLLFITLLAIVIPSLLSNFRSRVLMLLVAFAASFVFLQAKERLPKIGLLVSFVVAGYISVAILNALFGFSIIDRFTLQDEREDVNTIVFRGKSIERSIDMGLAYPFTGVGLGNYYDHLPLSHKARHSIFGWVKKEAEIGAVNPHNIFAQTISETGIISLIFYLSIFVFFAYKDTRAMFSKHTSSIQKAYTISFWTLFIYAIFNPTTTLTYNTLFWVLRVMILS